LVGFATMPVWWMHGGFRRRFLDALLREAIAMGRLGLVRALLALGADVNGRDLSAASVVELSEPGEFQALRGAVALNMTMLMYAERSDVARILIDHGADVNTRDAE